MISVVKSQRQLMFKGTHLLEGPKGRKTELVLERSDAIMIISQNNEGRPRGVREGLGAIRSAQDDADELPRVQKLLSLEARDKSLEAIHFKESVCGR